MQEQGMARRGGAAFIWKWGAICGVVLGVIQIIISLLPLGSLKTILDLLVWLIGFFVIGLVVLVALELGLGAGIGALGGLVGRRQAPPVASTPVAGTVWTPPPSAQ